MAYFKSSIPENQLLTVRITERFQSTQGTYGPEFPYKIVWQGVAYDHKATLSEEKGLQKFQVGQEVQVTKKLNSYGKYSLYWSDFGSQSGASTGYTASNPPPSQPKPLPAKPEVDWDAIADSKILFGFMVAFIEQGKDENQAYSHGMAAFRLHKKGETEMRTGVPAIPQGHSPAQLAEVNAVFGTDNTPRLPEAPLPDSMDEYNESAL